MNRLDRERERIRRRFIRIEARVDKCRERFIQRWGRRPAPQDSSFIKAMMKAGADALYVYAFWKTGILIVTPYGSDDLSPEELDIWDKAICEYGDLTGEFVEITRPM